MNSNNKTKSNQIVPTGSDDYLFVQQYLNRKVRLSSFKMVQTVILEAEGQNKVVEFKPRSYDFLVKDLQVFGFCQAGNFLPNGDARDLITLTLKNTLTDDFLVDAGTDIQAYSPKNVTSPFTPTIMPRNSGFAGEFKHERAVADSCLDFPKSNAILTAPPAYGGWEEGLAFTDSVFPVRLQLIISGAKIFPFSSEDN